MFLQMYPCIENGNDTESATFGAAYERIMADHEKTGTAEHDVPWNEQPASLRFHVMTIIPVSGTVWEPCRRIITQHSRSFNMLPAANQYLCIIQYGI